MGKIDEVFIKATDVLTKNPKILFPFFTFSTVMTIVFFSFIIKMWGMLKDLLFARERIEEILKTNPNLLEVYGINVNYMIVLSLVFLILAIFVMEMTTSLAWDALFGKLSLKKSLLLTLRLYLPFSLTFLLLILISIPAFVLAGVFSALFIPISLILYMFFSILFSLVVAILLYPLIFYVMPIIVVQRKYFLDALIESYKMTRKDLKTHLLLGILFVLVSGGVSLVIPVLGSFLSYVLVFPFFTICFCILFREEEYSSSS
ncbi:MAG: hypothetical protein ACE5K0_04265 [Candidatus Methanofastidiosia archaeon]